MSKASIDSHALVAAFFEGRGFTVFGKRKKISANGFDLMASKGDDIVSIEVKRIRFSSRTYRINLLPTQRKADILALVSDSGTVMPIPMSLVVAKKGQTICLGGWIGDL